MVRLLRLFHRAYSLYSPITRLIAASDDEHFDDVPQEKRQLGLVSVIFLIFNRIIGTGIFATPSSILRSAGSVGMAFILCVLLYSLTYRADDLIVLLA